MVDVVTLFALRKLSFDFYFVLFCSFIYPPVHQVTGPKIYILAQYERFTGQLADSVEQHGESGTGREKGIIWCKIQDHVRLKQQNGVVGGGVVGVDVVGVVGVVDGVDVDGGVVMLLAVSV